MYGNKVAPLYSLAEEGKKMRKSMKNIKYCRLWQKEGIVLLSPVILRRKPLSLISDVICHMESKFFVNNLIPGHSLICSFRTSVRF